jgi:hypothetical protein
MIVKDAALVSMGLVPRYSEVPCATLIFHDDFDRWATSPNMTEKPTPTSDWRITASYVEWKE